VLQQTLAPGVKTTQGGAPKGHLHLRWKRAQIFCWSKDTENIVTLQGDGGGGGDASLEPSGDPDTGAGGVGSTLVGASSRRLAADTNEHRCLQLQDSRPAPLPLLPGAPTPSQQFEHSIRQQEIYTRDSTVFPFVSTVCGYNIPCEAQASRGHDDFGWLNKKGSRHHSCYFS
jgi:hypothetical protein